ncbi:alpha/beta hydrolase [Paraburkholderia sediminicola]|uniref:alpha/beta hydrolase n=1 Tax=Paraburkholderia sediminicola TaxID=458836 RepID=UPI0038BAAC81
MKSHKLVGTGPLKVLLFPGLLGTRDSFDDMLKYADTDAFQYAVGEYRGYGQSRAEPGLMTLREIVLDAVRTIEFLGWTELAVVGHSLGALVAQMVAVAMPQRVKAIVSIAGLSARGADADPPRLAFIGEAAVSHEKRETLFRKGTADRYSIAAARAVVAESFDSINPAAFESYARDASATDISDEVRGLSAAVLAMIGEHDSNCTEALAKETTLSFFRKAELEVIAGAGHYPMIEAPLQTVAALERFVAKALEGRIDIERSKHETE